jgi:hypothetical protein
MSVWHALKTLVQVFYPLMVSRKSLPRSESPALSRMRRREPRAEGGVGRSGVEVVGHFVKDDPGVTRLVVQVFGVEGHRLLGYCGLIRHSMHDSGVKEPAIEFGLGYTATP